MYQNSTWNSPGRCRFIIFPHYTKKEMRKKYFFIEVLSVVRLLFITAFSLLSTNALG